MREALGVLIYSMIDDFVNTIVLSKYFLSEHSDGILIQRRHLATSTVLKLARKATDRKRCVVTSRKKTIVRLIVEDWSPNEVPKFVMKRVKRGDYVGAIIRK